MEYFHGTTIKGLSELKPFASQYSYAKKALVYLTTSKQLALHYIWDEKRLGVKMPMLDIRKDGVLVFQEMFSGALKYFYQGVSGYVYRCIGDYKIDSDTGIYSCATASETVPIADYEYIEDVYDRILSYADQGTFIYERYEDLPQWRIDLIRGQIIRFIKRNELLNDMKHPSYQLIREKFPRYWQEAQVLNEHNLL